jgi:hypothetical protein
MAGIARPGTMSGGQILGPDGPGRHRSEGHAAGPGPLAANPARRDTRRELLRREPVPAGLSRPVPVTPGRRSCDESTLTGRECCRLRRRCASWFALSRHLDSGPPRPPPNPRTYRYRPAGRKPADANDTPPKALTPAWSGPGYVRPGATTRERRRAQASASKDLRRGRLHALPALCWDVPAHACPPATPGIA